MSDPTAGFPDRTRRAYDQIMTHVHGAGEEAAGRWVAIRLSDGGSDGVLYDSKMDAARHQLSEKQCAYVCIPPYGVVHINELHTFLTNVEKIYETPGARLSDVGTHIAPPRLGYQA